MNQPHKSSKPAQRKRKVSSPSPKGKKPKTSLFGILQGAPSLSFEEIQQFEIHPPRNLFED